MLALTKKMFTRVLSFVLIVSFISLSFGVEAFALKEREMIPFETIEPKADVFNEQWLQIYMVEKEYNMNEVTNTTNYSIISADDPDFSSPVKPELIHHRYFTEYATYKENHGAGNIARMQVVYRIYLKMPEIRKFKEDCTYTLTIDSKVVSGVNPLEFTYEGPNEVIHVNQVGYISNAPKVGYLSWWTGQGSIDFADFDTFYVINEDTGEPVYTGDVVFNVAGSDEKWGGSNLYSMDFSPVVVEGNYHLYIPGVGTSYSFKISNDIYKEEIGYTLIRGIMLQRDGDHGLDDPDVTYWNRPAAHLQDAIDEATGQLIDLTGGHMDAGDRGKYPVNVAMTSTSMLNAIRLFPEGIEALGETLEMPESGNGIPDFVDEAIIELDLLKRMVMLSSKGGALPQWLRPTTQSYEENVPLEGLSNRTFYTQTQGPHKPLTLYAAGALAMAYNTPMIHEYYPEEYVNEFLAAAERAFQTYVDNEDNDSFWKSDYSADPHRTGKEWWSDELLVAAVNLLEATGDVKYMDYINEHLPESLGRSQKRWGWQNEGPWLDVYTSIYKSTNPLLDGIRESGRLAILDWAEESYGPNKEKPYGVPYEPATYNNVGWYFTGSQTSYPLMIAYGVSGDKKYYDRLVTSWNYLLGSNPISRSFISGLGDPQKSPRWLVHEITQYQYAEDKMGKPGWTEIIPGLPAADLQDLPGLPGSFNDSWNTARKTGDSGKRFPVQPGSKDGYTEGQFPALYMYTDMYNPQDEYVISQLARQSASIVPLIATKTFELKTTAENGSVYPDSGEYITGTELTLTATADLGYKFDSWSGDIFASANPYSVTVSVYEQDFNVVANFIPGVVYDLDTEHVNGNIILDKPGGQYNEGDQVTVRAVPDSGYTFVGWGGDLSGTVNPQVITMDSHKSIIANFEEVEPVVFDVQIDNGIVMMSPQKTEYYVGDQVVLQAVPDTGYIFVDWSGDVSSSMNPITVKLSGDTTITANIREIEKFTLEIQSTTGGSVSVTPNAAEYDEGTMVELTAATLPGYIFVGWSGDLRGINNPAEISMDANKNITAKFVHESSVIPQDFNSLIPGYTEEEDGTYTLTGSGPGYELRKKVQSYQVPGYHYAYMNQINPSDYTNGIFSVSARIDSVDFADNASAAGIWINNLSGKEKLEEEGYVAFYLNSKNELEVVSWQPGSKYVGEEKKKTGISLPIYIKIEWQNGPRKAFFYTSSDGESWELFTDVGMWGFENNRRYTAGLFVDSGNSIQNQSTAVFSDVTWPREILAEESPFITLSQSDETVKDNQYVVSGTVINANALTVQVNNGATEAVDISTGAFSTTVTLIPGVNTITATATNTNNGSNITEELLITYVEAGKQARGYKTEHAPLLDGNVDTAEWQGAEFFDVDRTLDGITENTAQFGALWDDEYLYVAVIVSDDVVYAGSEFADGSPAYDHDGAEVYLDMANKLEGFDTTKCTQLAVAPGDDFVTAWRWSDGVITKSAITDTGYAMEMAIPWATFSTVPNELMKIGLDIGINDDDTKAARRGVLMWSGTMDNWKQSNDYGQLTLLTENEDPGQSQEPDCDVIDFNTVQPGSTTLANGTYTLTGSGSGAKLSSGTPNKENIPTYGFLYAHQDNIVVSEFENGKLTISAKIESVNPADNGSSAGIMIRFADIAPNSATVRVMKDEGFAALYLQGGKLMLSRWRGNTWPGYLGPENAVQAPIYVKLEFEKSTRDITTYTSSDGETWVEYHKFNDWEMGKANIFSAGMFVDSGDSTTNQTTAVFSEVDWPREIIADPSITLSQSNETVKNNQYVVSGTVANADALTVQVNDEATEAVDISTGAFSATVTLIPGVNTITVTATNTDNGKTITEELLITYVEAAKQARGYKTEHAPLLDGIVDTAEWQGAEFFDVDRTLDGITENTAQFGALWDDEYLYVAVIVSDDVVYAGSEFADGSPAYEHDGAEVYLDMANKLEGFDTTKCTQLAVAPGDDFVTAWRWSDGVITKSGITDTGYAMEMAIPWATFTTVPEELMRIGFDIGINDDDTGAGRSGVLMWSGTMDNWKQSNDYGQLLLLPESEDPDPVQEPDCSVNQNNGTVSNDSFTVSGTVSNANKVTVKVNEGAEQEISINVGEFSTVVTLVPGENTIVVKAENTVSGAFVTEVLHINYEVPGPEYTLTIGNELQGGVGRTREITIGGTEASSLNGKYLVVQFTEGSSEEAKVSVLMISLDNENVMVSYPVQGTKVDVWLTSGMPNLVGEDMEVSVYAHTNVE